MTPLHIAILMGGWSAEREVSLTSGTGVGGAVKFLTCSGTGSATGGFSLTSAIVMSRTGWVP